MDIHQPEGKEAVSCSNSRDFIPQEQGAENERSHKKARKLTQNQDGAAGSTTTMDTPSAMKAGGRSGADAAAVTSHSGNNKINIQDEQESKRLNSIVIPQQFAWTGLLSSESTSSSGTVNAGAASTILKTDHKEKDSSDPENKNNHFSPDDLVLWNILGFAVDTSPDYLHCQLVCKRWRDMVNVLVPPVVIAMTRWLGNTTVNQKGKIIPLEKGALLWKQALLSCQNRDSCLYRKNAREASPSTRGDKLDESQMSSSSWPTLQPQFAVTMMLFMYQVCSQRSPNNGSKVLYESTQESLTELATVTVQQFWSEVGAAESAATATAAGGDDAGLRVRLAALVAHWQKWQGLVDTVDGLAGYLNRYYAPHYSLPSITAMAEKELVTQWRASLSDHEQCASAQSFLEVLEGLLAPSESSSTQKQPENKNLLLKLLGAGKSVQSMMAEHPSSQEPLSTEWKVVGTMYSRLVGTLFADADDSLVDDSQSGAPARPLPDRRLNCEASMITIKSHDGAKFSVPVGGHFITSSGFLARLKLQAGDVIGLWLESHNLADVLNFYRMNEVQPMGEIEKPLVRDLQQLISEQYWTFVSEIPTPRLFELTSAANLLDCKELLELVSASIANMIRNRSPEELRATFNITNDFDPEEEEQVRRENRWVED